MIKLRYGYLGAGFATGLILIFIFIGSLPDGKLHIVYCNVGQGDAAYVRFPDGRDMLIDGGPDDSVLTCLGKHMPFWDRTIDLVLLSHPEKDHLAGLVSVLERYRIGYFVRSNVAKDTEVNKALFASITRNKVPERLVTAGGRITIGSVDLAVIWPSAQQIAMDHGASDVLGATASVNRDCIVLWLRYGNFDALFPGDADVRTEADYLHMPLADRQFEVLKVPHHGSKTGMTPAFLDWLKPTLAIISVGKNSFGQPAPDTLMLLAEKHIKVLRTDKASDIEIISDGLNWRAK